ncbi:hypothetical protein DEO72_LG6g3322 [Vigna unguiculata]|uniref:Uncharacterized protein n=1 Tax=Vigna unguiculata TaxID=3917 RepID=A0A4D6MCU7_VIGUN|nr:hypothetical protein DEO72_LG5g2332 [Vigna unguiculata]QCD98600.1 hypothetical protein DEO72_LG6g3322 [Vigna unguiculata]
MFFIRSFVGTTPTIMRSFVNSNASLFVSTLPLPPMLNAQRSRSRRCSKLTFENVVVRLLCGSLPEGEEDSGHWTRKVLGDSDSTTTSRCRCWVARN